MKIKESSHVIPDSMDCVKAIPVALTSANLMKLTKGWYTEL